MPEWTRQQLRELLEAWWPGEWGNDPATTGAPVVVYRSTDIDDDGHLREDGGAYRFIAPTKLRAKKLTPGDVLLETSGGAPDRPVGRTALFRGTRNEPAVAANFIRTLRPKNGVSSEYLNLLLLHLHQQPAIWRYQQQTTGMSNLKVADYLSHELEVPAGEEQSAIAAVLQAINDALDASGAMIAKTQHVKTGMMHDLFTRGVTPGGALRPIRAEAPELYKETSIGWIPLEWDVQPLGWLGEIVSGVTLGSSQTSGNAITVPYLRVANVQDGYLDLSEVKTISVPADQLQRLRLKTGDVLMNEGGDYDKLGRGCVWEGAVDPCIHQNHVFRVRPNRNLLQSRYLAYWSQSEFGRRYFIISSKQSTNLASINSTQLHRFPVALPPPLEQVQIQRILDCVTEQSNALQDELAKLGDVKRGLMHDLLTGRVRVCAD